MIQGSKGWRPRVEGKGGRSFPFLPAFLFLPIAAFAFWIGDESAAEEGLTLTIILVWERRSERGVLGTAGEEAEG